MSGDDESLDGAMTVFDALDAAVAAAERDESEFAQEITEGLEGADELYAAFATWAAAAFESSTSLRASATLHDMLSEVAGAVDDPSFRTIARLPYVRPLLDNPLAREGVARMRAGSPRLVGLLEYLLEARLRPIAEQYLASVARLYIWGFDDEAVILARSALDASLEVRLRNTPAENVAKDLYDRIRAAGPRNLRILDQNAYAAAEQLRLAGNHAVHTQLGTQKLDALQAIKVLGGVVAQLFPLKP